MHAVTDNVSPVHKGFQMWNGDATGHGPEIILKSQAGPRGVDVITFRKSLEGFSAAEKNLAEGVNASIRYLHLETCSCEK